MERSLNAIENWFRGTRFFDFKCADGFAEAYPRSAKHFDGFVNGRVILPDPGPISYRGPGSANFLYSRPGDDRVSNVIFSDTAEYRAAATFVKVYPICGTDGYFSLQPSNDPKSYLIAVDIGSGNIVARAVPIDNKVDVIDTACWREIKGGGCPDEQVMIENKKYPGLVMVVGRDSITIGLGSKDSKIENNCWEKSPANTTLNGLPVARRKDMSTLEIRNGWNLSDNNISFGPMEKRSYELQPTFARNADDCAEKAAEDSRANGFVYLGSRFPDGNCKIKVGGYWNENRNRYDVENHKPLISGKFA